LVQYFGLVAYELNFGPELWSTFGTSLYFGPLSLSLYKKLFNMPETASSYFRPAPQADLAASQPERRRVDLSRVNLVQHRYHIG
jgi:hypothetical protein